MRLSVKIPTSRIGSDDVGGAAFRIPAVEIPAPRMGSDFAVPGGGAVQDKVEIPTPYAGSDLFSALPITRILLKSPLLV